MKRIQIFEFEDFDWFPSSIRSCMTNLIVVFLKLMGTPKVIATLIHKARTKLGFKRIVDMGSGSGSGMMLAVKELNRNTEDKIDLLMTDLHPNQKLVEKINSYRDINIKYQKEPLNATELGQAPEGIKTMINSFHHMTPEMAKQILKSAHDNKEPILIYELAENKIPFLLWVMLLPISLPLLMVMTLFLTPFVRPMTWQQLVFTYILPIIPICYAWDGQASLPRTYAFKDLEYLTSDLNEGYTWEIEVARKASGQKAGYYVLGIPLN